MADSQASSQKKDVAAATAAAKDKDKKKAHGPMYWFLRNLLRYAVTSVQNIGYWVKQKPVRNSVILAVAIILTLALPIILRPVFSHVLLDIRKYSGTALLIGGLLLAFFWIARQTMKHRLSGIIPRALSVVVVLTTLYYARTVHEYLALYSRHGSLETVSLNYLPTTGHERPQPLVSIETAARDVMSDTESPTQPDFVRGPDGLYRIVLAVEPAYFGVRANGSVDEILSIPGTSPSVAFSAEYREKVNFDVGENLVWSHNSYNCVVRTFGPWGLVNYEPTNVLYLKDTKGEWVQVVSLIRWTGVFFPRPEFGGVQIIRQKKGGFLRMLERVFLGCGEWVPPEEVGKYPFLRGQSLVSPVVSRFMADSFRFQNGFFAPLPFIRYGDIRIPDVEGDIAKQPFTAHFEFKDEPGGRLYHYFALEPFDENKRGLAISVFVPADGVGKIRVYDHAHRNESLVGVSAVGQIVKATRKEYDWEHNRPVEHRPYIKDIDGVRRMFFLTAIVTVKDEEGELDRYIAGATPEITLTDPVRNTVVWVDPYHPETWTAELKKKLAGQVGAK